MRCSLAIEGLSGGSRSARGGEKRMSVQKKIFGTTPFDGAMAEKGYALNKMCFSFNNAANRAAFKADEQAYMRAYGLNDQQAAAISARDVLGLLAAGGNVYYLAKFAGILALDVQDLGAAQTGMTKDAFKARLVAQNQQPSTM